MKGISKMKIRKDIPFGNLCAYSLREEADHSVIEFAADPHGGPESMWFCFRLEGSNGDENKKIRLVFKFFQNVLGGTQENGQLSIVAKKKNGNWERLGAGRHEISEDGQLSLVWYLNFTSSHMDFALCYPYGPENLAALAGNWKRDAVGVSQGGREIVRLSNSYGEVGSIRKGIYLIARQHSGETPGSWALHGFLDYFAKSGNNDFLVWAVPLSNIDGVVNGDYGKDNFPYDLNRAWGRPAMRHETSVIMQDMKRWADRCKPLVSLDLHAPGVCENNGIYSFVPRNSDGIPDQASSALAGKIYESLKDTGLAWSDFARSANYKSRWETPNFTSFSLNQMKLLSLSFEFPYSFIGKKELREIDYMQAGAVIAETVIKHLS